MRSLPAELRPFKAEESVLTRLHELFGEVKGVSVCSDRNGVIVSAVGFTEFTMLMFKTRSILRQAELLDKVCLGIQ